jgi:MFS transporter, DHA3 family, macrolide efflux protein
MDYSRRDGAQDGGVTQREPHGMTGPSTSWTRAFSTFWTGQALSLFGTQLVQFALVWWLTETTGSATVLATATLVGVLPNVFLAPVAGVLVDRWSRRTIMMASDAAVALATLTLAVVFALDVVQVWHVYLALFVRAAVGTFQFPAAQASTSLMVPPDQLARVAGLNQMLHGGMIIIAPPIGALLLGVLPLPGVLAVDVLTAVLAVGTLSVIVIPQPGRASGPKAPFWSEMRAGLRYTSSWPGLMALLMMATAINFFLTAALSLLPILATKHFGGTAMHLASLSSAFGIGIIAGGMALGVWGGFRRRMQTLLTGLIGLGLGFLLLGMTPATMFWMALAATVVAAVMSSMANGPLMAVLQTTVAPTMQGRVFTLMASMATAISPLGLAVAGPVADRLGVQIWYIVGGAVCMGMGILAFFIPSILNMEDHRAAPEAGESAVTLTSV